MNAEENHQLISKSLEILAAEYQPHIVVLYGSRARQDYNATSDIDMFCISDSPKVVGEVKHAEIIDNVALDAWIYPSAQVLNSPENVLHIGDGILLVDDLLKGQALIAAVHKELEKGPKPLSDKDKAHTVAWVDKMIRRAELNDIESHYRRTWLQFELLEIYFQWRGLWYQGPKKSFRYLQSQDETGYELFQAVYQNPINICALSKLAQYVLDR